MNHPSAREPAPYVLQHAEVAGRVRIVVAAMLGRAQLARAIEVALCGLDACCARASAASGTVLVA